MVGFFMLYHEDYGLWLTISLLTVLVSLTFQAFLRNATLDTYTLSDQPTCCPKCGRRTQFTETFTDIGYQQNHTCLNPECKYEFIGVDEDE